MMPVTAATQCMECVHRPLAFCGAIASAFNSQTRECCQVQSRRETNSDIAGDGFAAADQATEDVGLTPGLAAPLTQAFSIFAVMPVFDVANHAIDEQRALFQRPNGIPQPGFGAFGDCRQETVRGEGVSCMTAEPNALAFLQLRKDAVALGPRERRRLGHSSHSAVREFAPRPTGSEGRRRRNCV
jgi:hypothetical protein